jgi:hypothetical protein
VDKDRARVKFTYTWRGLPVRNQIWGQEQPKFLTPALGRKTDKNGALIHLEGKGKYMAGSSLSPPYMGLSKMQELE